MNRPRIFPARARCSGSFGKRGFVLVAILIVIMLASMVVLSLMFHLRAEETAVTAGAGAEQAWAAAMSGVQEALRVASGITPEELDWQDNPSAFHQRLIFDEGTERWYFTVFSMTGSERSEVRFGLTDEARKLNVNAATEERLGKIPGVTPYLAQSLADFLDADNAPRPEGAEQEYYDTLATPYAVANGPISSVDEMLLVRGFTPALLYGEDANANFQLDPNEDDADQQFPPDNKDGKLDSGLRQYLTVYSTDLNQDNSGARRIDLNDPQHIVSDKDFPSALVQYIAALRRNNVKLTNAAELLEAKAKLKDEKGQDVELASGVDKDGLAVVMDRFTASTDFRLPGLINVNTAPASVLQTIPDIDDALAESIVARRRYLRPEQRRTAAWIYEEGLVNADQFKKIAPFVTARGFQFHFHVVGYGMPSGRYRVLEAVADRSGPQPTIVYLRDITRLGMPFKLEDAQNDEFAKAPAKRRLAPSFTRSARRANVSKNADEQTSLRMNAAARLIYLQTPNRVSTDTRSIFPPICLQQFWISRQRLGKMTERFAANRMSLRIARSSWIDFSMRPRNELHG